MKTAKPVGTTVFLNIIDDGDDEKKLDNGIILPKEAAQNELIEAHVVGAGGGCEFIKKGDVALIVRRDVEYLATYTVNDGQITAIQEKNIVGYFRDGE